MEGMQPSPQPMSGKVVAEKPDVQAQQITKIIASNGRLDLGPGLQL